MAEREASGEVENSAWSLRVIEFSDLSPTASMKYRSATVRLDGSSFVSLPKSLF